MSPSFLSLPDDWLALAWCLVTMVVCLLLIRVTVLIRPRPTSRIVATAERTIGRGREARPDLDRSASLHVVASYIAAYRLRFSHGRVPVHVPGMRRPPRFER